MLLPSSYSNEDFLEDYLLSREYKLCRKFSKDRENKIKERAYNFKMRRHLFIEPD